MVSNTTLARMYLKGQLRDYDHGVAISPVHIVHKGPNVAIRSAAPPPVAAYDEWFAERQRTSNRRGRGKTPMTGAKLRRMVVMRRQGSTLKECGAAVGIGQVPAMEWLALLPSELGA